jgi:hypothetical protein
LPARLRYSELTLSSLGDPAGSGQLEVRFGDVVFGPFECESLRLKWQPGASHGSDPRRAPLLLIGSGNNGLQPLAGWPLDADGRPAEHLVLPVGPGMADTEKRRRWAEWSVGDRDLVLALLDALPACAQHADPASLPSGPTRPALEAAARALFVDACRSKRQTRVRHAVRSVLRRLRGR